MTAIEIISEKLNLPYAEFGIRAIDEEYQEGAYLPYSRRWEDGQVTDATLDGTSAVSIKADFYDESTWADAIQNALSLMRLYPAKYVYLIAGNGGTMGQDIDEIILRDAVVLHRFDYSELNK